jgi:hypothetical protein
LNSTDCRVIFFRSDALHLVGYSLKTQSVAYVGG